VLKELEAALRRMMEGGGSEKKLRRKDRINGLPLDPASFDSLHLDQLIAAAVFTGARVSGLMVFCPFLSSDAIPAPLKAALFQRGG